MEIVQIGITLVKRAPILFLPILTDLKQAFTLILVNQSIFLKFVINRNDTSRKPRGQVPLDKFCKIAPSEGLQTFELATSKRTYYLTAESPAVMEEWIKCEFMV